MQRGVLRNLLFGAIFAMVVGISARAVFASCNGGNGDDCKDSNGSTISCSCSGDGTCGGFSGAEGECSHGGCWSQCYPSPNKTYKCCIGPPQGQE